MQVISGATGVEPGRRARQVTCQKLGIDYRGNTNVDGPSEISACYVNLCISYCGIMLELHFHPSLRPAVRSVTLNLAIFREVAK